MDSDLQSLHTRQSVISAISLLNILLPECEQELQTEQMFLEQLAAKQRLFMRVMCTSEAEYKRLNAEVLSSDKKSLLEAEDSLAEIRKCWDCSHEMCFSCFSRLNPIMMALASIVNRYNATKRQS